MPNIYSGKFRKLNLNLVAAIYREAGATGGGSKDSAPAQLVKNSLVVYGVPMVALIAGAAVGAYFGRVWAEEKGTDVGAIIGAAVFLGLAVIVMRVLDRAAAGKVQSLPRVIEILEEKNWDSDEQQDQGGYGC